MNQAAYELGKRAGALVSRSVTIRMGKPGAAAKQRKAFDAKGHHNSNGPWQKGRKVKR